MENVAEVWNPSEDRLISKLVKPFLGDNVTPFGSPANTYFACINGVAEEESAGLINELGRWVWYKSSSGSVIFSLEIRISATSSAFPGVPSDQINWLVANVDILLTVIRYLQITRCDASEGAKRVIEPLFNLIEQLEAVLLTRPLTKLSLLSFVTPLFFSMFEIDRSLAISS